MFIHVYTIILLLCSPSSLTCALLSSPLPSSALLLTALLTQAHCEVHPVLRETFCCKDGHGVGPNKNDVPELLT